MFFFFFWENESSASEIWRWNSTFAFHFKIRRKKFWIPPTLTSHINFYTRELTPDFKVQIMSVLLFGHSFLEQDNEVAMESYEEFRHLNKCCTNMIFCFFPTVFKIENWKGSNGLYSCLMVFQGIKENSTGAVI